MYLRVTQRSIGGGWRRFRNAVERDAAADAVVLLPCLRSAAPRGAMTTTSNFPIALRNIKSHMHQQIYAHM